MKNLTPFDFQLPTRIVFGVDTVDQLGAVARELGGSRVLVVSDRGVEEAGLTQRGLDALCTADLRTRVFDELHENPTTEDVAVGLAAAQEFHPDLLVGLGGGSSIDCAKGINFLYTNGGRMKDYWGAGKAREPMLPMIAVPTTAGTGSEVQSYALISDAKTHAKMACGDKKATCRAAILDPRLTASQPLRVTALTGIDALAHAVESCVATRRTPVSDVLSRDAWRLLAANLSQVLECPTDLEARGAMQVGACLAGLAIENSMLGAAHGLANPLTARYGLAHGHAVGLMLPHVVRFNAAHVNHAYAELMELAGPGRAEQDGQNEGEGLAEFITSLLVRAGLAVRLSACGIAQDTLPELAGEAARQWTTSFNPRVTDPAALLSLYRQAF